MWCERLRHHRTFRGHNSAAYILAVEPTGRFFLTGSDDNVVKIWCARTGVLQASCCGHVVRRPLSGFPMWLPWPASLHTL